MAHRSLPLAVVLLATALLLGGCGEGQDYDRIYREALAERAYREDMGIDGPLPRCTSFGNRVVSRGPCVYGGNPTLPGR
jgi:hypothetical protein